MIVSNATLNLGQSDTGLQIGWGGKDCVLVLQGATPKVRSVTTYDHAFRFQGSGGLRFEVPVDGYDRGYVPVEVPSGAFRFNTEGCKLEIDCEDFVARTGGKLHLIHAASIDTDTATRMRNTCTLPEGCELIISGGDVYIKSRVKNRGFAIIYR